MVGIYSAFLGLFIPSAGGKWLIEAPYMLEAAKTLHVHLGWVVQTYNATEALANLIHPFWMLPLVGILGLKARDIVGYSMLQFVVHVPLVLFLVWVAELHADLRAARSCNPAEAGHYDYFFLLRSTYSTNCSFSRQISSISSASTTMRCLSVTVHGFV